MKSSGLVWLFVVLTLVVVVAPARAREPIEPPEEEITSAVRLSVVALVFDCDLETGNGLAVDLLKSPPATVKAAWKALEKTEASLFAGATVVTAGAHMAELGARAEVPGAVKWTGREGEENVTTQLRDVGLQGRLHAGLLAATPGKLTVVHELELSLGPEEVPGTGNSLSFAWRGVSVVAVGKSLCLVGTRRVTILTNDEDKSAQRRLVGTLVFITPEEVIFNR